MSSPIRITFLAAGMLAAAAASPAQVTWTQISATAAPMVYGGSAWDSVRSRLVAFGGEQGGTPGDFHREFDPATSQWTTLSVPRPFARRRPAMAFDAARAQCVLFGGGTGTSTFLAETWTWNGTSWTQRFPATSPSPRFGAAMAYDAVRDVVVLFGGFVPSGQDVADLWEWNGTTWTQRTFGNGPSPRGAHRMVFDAARGVTVLYGGYSTPQQTTLADTWTWDGTTWATGGGGPGSLCDQLFVYDSHRQRVVLFGGLRITPAQTDLAATWEWNGATWTQRTTATTPSARSAMACGFVPGDGRIVSGGGATNTGTQFGTTFALRPVTPAQTSTFGQGCPASAGPIALDATSQPYIGTTFEQQISGASLGAGIAILVLGASNTSWNGVPLPLDLTVIGAPGCSANVSLDALVTLVLVNGAATLAWPLPNQPTLVGQTFYSQGVVLDPASPLPFQIGVSPGRQFTLGAP